jgi:A/G-specific adenine glycosylase
MTALPKGFAGRIVRWQQSHGRSHLPWQDTHDPYRVWLSEIMLQQTQVATVLDYYARFLDHFPDVRALAQAHEDEVLSLWSGLGYYSRARNMHRCAKEVMERFAGEFPRSAAQLETLPGIGRSTAAAIAAFCFGERAAILDGNVKRVLTRVLAFDDDLASSTNERKLWHHATELLPARNLAQTMPRYTQGLMDLGATVCLSRNPSCLICPVQSDCAAHREGTPEKYPVKTKKLRRSAQSLWLLRARTKEGAVWLHKRPSEGVWAGLYCLPAFESRAALEEAMPLTTELRDEAVFTHVLTHKDLHLHPIEAIVSRKQKMPAGGAWFDSSQWPKLGLPSPIRKLLEQAGD